jgi:hypothetical protein
MGSAAPCLTIHEEEEFEVSIIGSWEYGYSIQSYENNFIGTCDIGTTYLQYFERPCSPHAVCAYRCAQYDACKNIRTPP